MIRSKNHSGFRLPPIVPLDTFCSQQLAKHSRRTGGKLSKVNLFCPFASSESTLRRFVSRGTISPGFTLIEALLATIIMGLLLSPMIITESSIFQRVVRLSKQFERMLQAQDFLYQTRRTLPKDSRTFTTEKKLTKPTTTVRYELIEPQADSAFGSVRNILVERVSWEWMEGSTKRTESMVTLKYQPKAADAVKK